MKVKLVGVHKVKTKRADGSVAEYFYAWRGGPRMVSKPGTTAFTQEFARLTKDRAEKAKTDTVAKLVEDFRSSADFQKLKPSTRRDYERIMGVIKVRFATFPIEALAAKGARRVFVGWRDEMKDTPRSADLHLAVLARVFSWAADLEMITRNPLERIGKLHSGSRKDAIWRPGQLAKMLAEGRKPIVDVVKMALWTMQRQGDLLTMPTMAYSDGHLWINQSKTGARVRIRPADEILPILESAKAASRQRLLVNSYGENWTSCGFRASLRKEMARLEIKGVTFHDLRGTGISYAAAMGVDVKQIAMISGHSERDCEAIIRKHYLAGSDVIEAIRAGTKSG